MNNTIEIDRPINSYEFKNLFEFSTHKIYIERGGDIVFGLPLKYPCIGFCAISMGRTHYYAFVYPSIQNTELK